MIAVVANVFEIDAMGKMVSGPIGCGYSTLVTPNPRIMTWPFLTMPTATPGTLYSAIFFVTRAASASNFGSDCGERAAPRLTVRATRAAATDRRTGRVRIGVV
jgi:hypothetical protein